MKKTTTILIVILIAIVSACTSNEANPTQKNEGYILEVEEGTVLIAKDISAETYDDIKDKSLAEITEQGKISLIYLSYNNTANFQIGDHVTYQIDGGIDTSYPEQAAAKKIKIIQ